MLRIEMLPAAQGDALLVEYGSATRPHRLLVDGGPAGTYQKGLRRRLAALPAAQRRFDLAVITHVDTDHIDGGIILLQEARRLGVTIDQVWFNGWRQLAESAPGSFAPEQGEFLSGLIQVDKGLAQRWNTAAGKGPIAVPAEGPLPAYPLPGGALLTILSPSPLELRRLGSRWSAAIREFSPGDAAEALRRLEERRDYRPPEPTEAFSARTFGDDRSVANGSSIAFLLEHEGCALLLAGDAHARVLAASLRRLAAARGKARIRVDAVKLPHHGSLSNVSEELLAAVETERWLVSTNGAIFGHPDVETARLIAKHQPRATFVCNYKVATTEELEREGLEGKIRWRTLLPGSSGLEAVDTGGVRLTLAGGKGRSRGRTP